jgi:hypothetical protein
MTAESLDTDSSSSDIKHKYNHKNKRMSGFFNGIYPQKIMSGRDITTEKPESGVVNGRVNKQYTINMVPSAYHKTKTGPESKSKFFSRMDTMLEDENFRWEKKAHMQDTIDYAELQRLDEQVEILPWKDPNAIKSKIQNNNFKFQKKKCLDDDQKDSDDQFTKYLMPGPNSINLNTQGGLLAKTRDKLQFLEASLIKQTTYMTPIEQINNNIFDIAMEKLDKELGQMPKLGDHRQPLVRNMTIESIDGNRKDKKWVKWESKKIKKRNKIEASLIRALDPYKVIVDRLGSGRVNKSFDCIRSKLKRVDGNNLGLARGLEIWEKDKILPSQELLGKLDL